MESITISGGSDPTIGVNTIFELFEKIIGNNQRFVVAQIEPIPMGQMFIVHVKDNSQHTLLNITLVPGTYTGRHQSEFVIQIANTSDQILFTAKGFSLKEMTLWSGGDGKYLGKLDFASGICSSNLHVKGANDELLFQMESDSGGLCYSHPSELSSIANGVPLALVQSFNNGSPNLLNAEISLLNSRNVDTRTKFFLIFVGWQLYVTFFAKITGGRTGMLRDEMYCQRCIIIVFVSWLIMVIAFPIILPKLIH